ncbi:uncharacterized protein [Montipora foliosa]|uniref:uncharacterized protein n=1 Tax=Montipora foliosa TaxID=591990 RepID=UPI0035F20EA0
MVTEDCHRGKRNLSMAWVDVAKAYDSIDHKWLDDMMILHSFPTWLKNVTSKLSASWNTRIQCKTDKGTETSDVIRFRSGLPQGDALCPRLFTLCMNPVAWILKATEGYKLSRLIRSKITDLLYIDDLKIFAASQTKLATQSHYKFLGVLENIKQEDQLALECASKEYLKRLSVIWTSPLSDVNKVTASNQYALPVLSYLMPAQRWTMSELQRIDREVGKVMVENGRKHPAGSSALLYLPRAVGGRGMKSVETVYKVTKIKTALTIYSSADPSVKLVKNWHENLASKGRHSVLADAVKYAREFGLDLELTKPTATCQVASTGDEISDNEVPDALKKAITSRLQQEVMDQKWQGKITAARWEDQDLSLKECYTWLKGWKAAPTHTIAGIEELHQRLLPTKIYHQKKTGVNTTDDIMCRMCGEKPECLVHVLDGCSVLAQTKYLSRHNAALKIPFFEMLKDMDLIESNPPWYSPVQPKPVYENDKAVAYWDVPVYEESTVVKSNRVDVRIVDKEKKEVLLMEMTCAWIGNRGKMK